MTDPPLYPWMGDGYESWAESLRERERQRVNAKNQRTYHRTKGSSSPEQRAQKAAYLREWRQKNREHVNARERARYHADLDAGRAKRRAKYRAKKRPEDIILTEYPALPPTRGVDSQGSS